MAPHEPLGSTAVILTQWNQEPLYDTNIIQDYKYYIKKSVIFDLLGSISNLSDVELKV